MSPNEDVDRESLDQNEILIAEFEYSSDVTLQSNEELSRVTNLYLVALGSVVAGILGLNTNNFDPDFLKLGLSIVSGFFCLFSLLIITQLARVRFTWFDSIEAMNKIKKFYLEEHNDLNQAFHWSELPKKYKRGSSSSIWAIFIAIIGGVAAFLSVLFGSNGFEIVAWLFAIGIGFLFVFLQLWIYKRGLGK